MATEAMSVIDSFESSFQDKCVIPTELEMLWLSKAVAKFGMEVEPIAYDSDAEMFDDDLDQYTIDTLAQIMRVLYQEREYSKVSKRVSIVTKSLSIDGNGNAKTASKNDLDYHKEKMEQMLNDFKLTAYN